MYHPHSLLKVLPALLLLAGETARIHAQPFIVPELSLSTPAVPATAVVHFDEVPEGSAINGLSIKGFSFSENIPNATTMDGPGSTPPVAVSGNGYYPGTYVLTIEMPAAVTSLGFGFTILDPKPTANALTITLFNGAMNLGSLTYGATPPNPFSYDEGFAGIGSTKGFTSAQITFGPSALAYALDNVAAVAVPEPNSAVVGLSLLGMGLVRRYWGAYRPRSCTPSSHTARDYRA